MEQTTHIHILKRIGAVMLAVGLLDIGAMIYCIMNEIAYSSSFNIFAAVAGIFLLRGSLRAASAVRWIAIFMLFAFAGWMVALPFMQPISLTLLQLRLKPGALALSALFLICVFLLLVWLCKSLGNPLVLAARDAAGRPRRNMCVPAGLGLGVLVAAVVGMHFMLGGESATKAMQVAQNQLGSGYKYHVQSISIISGSNGTSVNSVVTAWNSTEIRNVPVTWQER